MRAKWVCLVLRCECKLKSVTVLQTDAQGDGKTGGTLWVSLLSLPTLVVLSFESLRSSFICLPSKGGATAMVSSLPGAGLADLKKRK